VIRARAYLKKAEIEMRSWDALPHSPLKPMGPLSAEFIALGITDVQGAGRYLQTLPYGRTAERADFRAVLRQGRGTCSTKHALLAALADEQRLPLDLTLGIYEMHERNTPGVGVVLARYHLPFIPEAHCYLTDADSRIDVTRCGAEAAEPIARFLHEETIVPEQIGDYKVAMHRQFMQDWVNHHPDKVQGLGFEALWQVREACIAALAQ
jgi:hypothetical protein